MQTSTSPLPARPKSRRRWYILGGFVLLLFATPFAYQFIAGWLIERELQAIYREIEADDPHWRWADLVAQSEPIPDERNAALQVLKVYGLLNMNTLWPGPKWRDLPVGNTCLSADQVLLLRTALNAQRPEALVEARRLKDMPEGRYIVPDEGGFLVDIAKMAGDAQPTRTVMSLLQMTAALHEQDQEMEEAAQSCLALVNVVHAFNDHPSYMMQLPRNVGKSFIAETVEHMLGQGEVSAEGLQQLQAAMEREAAVNSLYHGMRGERADSQRWMEELKDGRMHYSEMGGTKATFEEHLYDWLPGLFLGGYPEFLRLTHQSVRASKLPLEAQEAEFAEIERQAEQKLNPTFRRWMGGRHKVRDSYRRCQAILQCAIIAVAVERFRVKNGFWPNALNEVIQEDFLKEIATDPYDGQPLRWRRTKTGAVIYSVGRDMIDDGGKLSRNPNAPNTDWGVELWDKSYRHAPAPVDEEGSP